MYPYRHALAAAFLTCIAAPAHAVCSDVTAVEVTVTSSGGTSRDRVQYDPFDPRGSDVFIAATYDGPCDGAHGARIHFPATGGTIADFPEMELRSEAGVVYRTTADYTETAMRSAPFPVVGAGEQTGTATLAASLVAQGTTETAFGPTGNGTLDIDAVFEVDGGAVVRKSLRIPVETVLRRTIALTDNFAMGATTGAADFGKVTASAAVISKNFWLWSNANFRITAVSPTGGVMIREGAEADPSDINTIPYTLAIADPVGGGQLLVLDGTALPGIARETPEIASTSVDGDVYDIRVDIAAGDGGGKRAGRYEDTVTLTVLPPL